MGDEATGKDYAVTIKVRNNRLLQKMKEAGVPTAAALHRASGVTMGQIMIYMGLKRAPVRPSGVWSASAIALSECLRCLPEDMFPAVHIRTALAKNKADFTADATDIHQISASLRSMALPTDEKMMIAESAQALSGLLDVLTPRERKVIDHRFGLVDGTEGALHTVPGEDGRKERVRQIEARALMKLRKAARARKDAIYDAAIYDHFDPLTSTNWEPPKHERAKS